MKVFLALLTFISLLSFSETSVAQTSFESVSSGPNIYVCNAGIRKQNPSGNASSDQGDGSVTSDNKGEALQDVMIYQFKNVDIFEFFPATFENTTRAKAKGTRSWTTAAGFDNPRSNDYSSHKIDFNGAGERNRIIHFLQYELSSERYGTEYFVDVCYYGPRFGGSSSDSDDDDDNDNDNDGDNDSDDDDDGNSPSGNYIAQAQIIFTNLFNNNYRKLSNLIVRAELYCDGSRERRTRWSSANVSAKRLWSMHDLGPVAPGKCVTRYSFKETSNSFRPNGQHGARIKIRTTIHNTGDDDDSDDDGDSTRSSTGSESDDDGDSTGSSTGSESDDDGDSTGSSTGSESDDDGDSTGSSTGSESDDDGDSTGSSTGSESDDDGDSTGSSTGSESDDDGDSTGSSTGSESDDDGDSTGSSTGSESDDDGDSTGSSTGSESDDDGDSTGSSTGSESDDDGDSTGSSTGSESDDDGDSTGSSTGSESDDDGDSTGSSTGSESDDDGDSTGSSTGSESDDDGDSSESDDDD